MGKAYNIGLAAFAAIGYALSTVKKLKVLSRVAGRSYSVTMRVS
jgi:hypothetical protein